MADLKAIVQYTNTFLGIDGFQDYCPNGLQVEGAAEVKKIVSGVTASQALIDAAIKINADALLVHHGYFWKGDSPVVTGMHRQRLLSLLTNKLSLLAYHLPLDAHSEVGNNVQLAQLLEIDVHQPVEHATSPSLVKFGDLRIPCSAQQFCEHIGIKLGRPPLHIAGDKPKISSVAWCTGGAQSYFNDAVALGVDAFISGEISEPTVHIARETGVHYFAAGHHATERYGVQALGRNIAHKFGLNHQFIDIDNPV